VNLYGESVAMTRLPSGNRVRIDQETEYPVSAIIRITIWPERPEQFALHLRIPSWSRESMLAVGEAEPERVPAGAYARIQRLWQPGERVTLKLDLSGRLIRSPGSASHVAIMRGPIVLAHDVSMGADPPELPVRLKDDALGLIPLTPIRSPAWMAFRVPQVEGRPDIVMCDYASAGATWSADSALRVWFPAR
jgi:DUF1680 family protein